MIILEILRNIFLAPLELIFEVIFTIAFNITHSEGLAIIILSLVVSTLVLPLYKRAEAIEQEQRAKEKELSFWTEHIKHHFKGDEKYMMLDAYYRENHYNPIHRLKSSISILLQIPFFMAAYDLLGVRAANRFRGVDFLFFTDLSTPDNFLALGSIAINVMPILMTLINILATYIYTRGLPAKTILRSLILPLIFLIALYNSPLALLLYWTMNNLYSLVKTIIIKNAQKRSAEAQPLSGKTETAGPALGQRSGAALFVLAALFMSVLTGLLIPLAYLSASPEEFINVTDPQNPLRYLLSSFFVAVGFFVVWPGVFFYLAKPKLRNAFTILMIAASAFSAVDYLFFGTNTGTINTTLIFDRTPEYPVSDMLLNALIVLTIIAVCIFVSRFKKALTVVFAAVILTTLTISLINAKKVQDSYSLVISQIDVYRDMESPKITLSSTGDNVMVIMLDRAVAGYIPYVFNEYPELKEKFDGFVYYPNTVTFAQNTLKTTSALFGGYDYTPEQIDARADETLAVKHDEALKVLPEILSKEGYVTTLMDLPFPGWNWNGDYSSFKDIDNCFAYYPKDFYNSNSEASINAETRRNRNMFMYSIVRCAPLCLQGMIYDGGDYLAVGEDYYGIIDVFENYMVLKKLEEMTVLSDDYQGSLFLIDNETTHDVTTIVDFDGGYYISDGSKELEVSTFYQAATYECLVISMVELGNYMDYLKENGVYDNTRIIIVSDHGADIQIFDELQFEDVNGEWYNCLLMVKDFESSGFTTDDSFMTNADVPAIALDGIVEDPVNPYTGNPINTLPKNEGVFVSFSDSPDEKLWNPNLNNGNTFYYDEDCIWFKITGGDIFNEDNWVPIEKPGV
ncbi:MAG: membrane protein insertase YidC [Saccharofermentans sp.]|nr:membrane protein insertase YidC [Saccharofermentans sp.]